jgi:hypothetical protein
MFDVGCFRPVSGPFCLHLFAAPQSKFKIQKWNFHPLGLIALTTPLITLPLAKFLHTPFESSVAMVLYPSHITHIGIPIGGSHFPSSPPSFCSEGLSGFPFINRIPQVQHRANSKVASSIADPPSSQKTRPKISAALPKSKFKTQNSKMKSSPYVSRFTFYALLLLALWTLDFGFWTSQSLCRSDARSWRWLSGVPGQLHGHPPEHWLPQTLLHLCPVTNATLDITNLVRPCPCTKTGIPFHANLAQVISSSTNGERSLIDTNITIPAGTLHTGSVLRFEAFGSFGDPANNCPNAAFALKLGATSLVSVARPATTANWHLSASITFRTAGPAAVAIGSIAATQSNLSLDPFFFASQTATVDTTVPLVVDLTARYVDIAHTESISCEQFTLHLD